MSIKLVIFDMAGTTVHDKDNVNIAFQDAMSESGIEVNRKEVNEVMGMPKPLAIRIMMEKKLPEAEVTEERNEAIYQLFLQKMIDFYTNDPSVREIDGASDTFKKLKENGIKVGIDTGFARPIAQVIIDRLGWETNGLIDASVTSDEVANGRPHADLALKVMEILGVTDSSEVAKVGDTPADLGEGKAAGCKYNIGVTSGAYTREELEQHEHTHILSSLTELPQLLLN